MICAGGSGSGGDGSGGDSGGVGSGGQGEAGSDSTSPGESEGGDHYGDGDDLAERRRRIAHDTDLRSGRASWPWAGVECKAAFDAAVIWCNLPGVCNKSNNDDACCIEAAKKELRKCLKFRKYDFNKVKDECPE